MSDASAPVEIELKLAIDPAATAALRGHPAIRAIARARPRTAEVVSTYYDTPDCRLQRAGVALRLRRDGRRWLMTVKGAPLPDGATGVVVRPEFEWPLARPQIDAMRLATTPWRAVFAKAMRKGGLAPGFATTFRRTSVPLAFPDGTTATLAMGDALAVALLQKRGFKHDDFAQFHPGGSLGRRLLVKVRDLMQHGDHLPRVRADVSGADTILEMTSKKLGLTTVVDAKGSLYGIVTDGDLRRFIQAGGDFSRVTAGDLASRHPKTIGPDELATTAVAQMERFSITALVVIEPPNRLAGVIHLHDLLKHGIV